MKPIYQVQKNDKIPYIEPKLYPFPFDESGISNFPVPVDNAVGTASLNNAITFVYFEGNKLRFETRAKDFVSDNERGDLNYMPLFSKDKMGYAQTRLLRLLDLKTNKITTYPLSGFIHDQILHFSELDPSKNLCMVRLLRDIRKRYRIVKIIDFSKGYPVVKAEKFFDHAVNFIAFKDGVIIYNHDAKKLEILDTELKPLKHPLKDIYDNYLYNPAKNIYNLKEIKDITIHPTLPFAVINDERDDDELWVVSWGGGVVRIFKLISNYGVNYQFFSPDGKWFIIALLYKGKIYKQLMMRVDDKELPYYLGKPIEMKKPGAEHKTGNFAWTSNPMNLTTNTTGKYFNWKLSYSEIKGGDWRTVVPVKIKYKGVFGEIEK
ncbi:MAG: hypothetical protein GY714_32100 [Desulfobacterales bacterium]|nr:hypothetical protein [Desulfobacterales bacterium]